MDAPRRAWEHPEAGWALGLAGREWVREPLGAWLAERFSDSRTYRYRLDGDQMGAITVVRVHGTSTRSKFKLAQTTEADSRSQIVRSLRARRASLDERTADFIE